MSSDRERVVITGIGLISPLGLGRDATMESLRQGRCGIRFGSAADVLGPGFWPPNYGVCEGFDPARYVEDKKSIRTSTRRIHLALAATRLALEDADWGSAVAASRDEYEAGTLIAVGSDDGLDAFFPVVRSSMDPQGRFDYRRCGSEGVTQCPPLYIMPRLPNTAAAQIAIQNKVKGLNFSVVNGPSGGAIAIGEAYRAIRTGRAVRMICGAAAGPASIFGAIDRDLLDGLLSHGENGSRPFSRDRDGLILGEGAAILVLESEGSARARRVRIYAELTGYANTYNPRSRSSFENERASYARAMHATLRNAGLAPTQISSIQASGVGLPIEDAAESAAIQDVFAQRARHVPISATKSQTGYLDAASSALEPAIAALGVCHGLVAPTIRWQAGDPRCDLDYVGEHARQRALSHVLCMSYEPCGSNVGLVVSNYLRGSAS